MLTSAQSLGYLFLSLGNVESSPLVCWPREAAAHSDGALSVVIVKEVVAGLSQSVCSCVSELEKNIRGVRLGALGPEVHTSHASP